MTSISIQSALPLPLLLLMGALDREKRILRNSVKTAKKAGESAFQVSGCRS